MSAKIGQSAVIHYGQGKQDCLIHYAQNSATQVCSHDYGREHPENLPDIRNNFPWHPGFILIPEVSVFDGASAVVVPLSGK